MRKQTNQLICTSSQPPKIVFLNNTMFMPSVGVDKDCLRRNSTSMSIDSFHSKAYV